jgi:Phosphoinositide phospholipase C, Ca2+-dependent
MLSNRSIALCVGVLCCAVRVVAAAPDSASSVKLNQIQVIGTHNSYHAGLAPSEAKLLE